MKNTTAAGAKMSATELEEAASSILGRMLFDFSRLEVALGLFLVWTGEGRKLDALTSELADYTFHKKLEFLKGLVGERLKKGTDAYSGYSQWLALAHSVRITRNQLVHGRWGVDATRQQIINVRGLPTSPDQKEVFYSLQALQEVLSIIRDLPKKLQKLGKQWPI